MPEAQSPPPMRGRSGDEERVFHPVVAGHAKCFKCAFIYMPGVKFISSLVT